jgi:hypothetical protein
MKHLLGITIEFTAFVDAKDEIDVSGGAEGLIKQKLVMLLSGP